MAPGQWCTRGTRTYTSADAQSPEALYVSDITLLSVSVQLPTSLTLHLGLQRGPTEAPHFPAIHVVRRSAGEENFGSKLRIKSSVPRFLMPVSRGRSSSRFSKATFGLGCRLL